jgi:hypothetical protein
MLTNVDAAGTGDFSGQLMAFFAESPLSSCDAWRPHLLNPICSDAAVARNGGVFFRDGTLYRVAQRPGFGVYGKRFSVRKIERLDEENFQEVEVVSSEQILGRGVSRTHHFHVNEEGTVFDFVGKLDGLGREGPARLTITHTPPLNGISP